MEILLSLLRTLIFVVATVAATVYVSRRIGRGRSLLWTGTTLLALYWLVLFGWTAYLAGSTAPNAELGVWVGWTGHLLPFLATLSYIWGIGQAAGFPSRAGAAAGASLGKGSAQPVPPASTPDSKGEGQPPPATPTPATPIPVPTAPVSRFAAPNSNLPGIGGSSPVPPSVGTPAQPAGSDQGTVADQAVTDQTAASDQTAAGSAQGAAPSVRSKRSFQPFPGPHAVPVVTTPSASSQLSPAEPPKPPKSSN